MEGDGRAAPVGGRAGGLQLRGRLAAREGLDPGLPVARHLDDQLVGQRIDDRDADAVQAARGRVDLAVELAARMQRGEDDLQRRLVLELGMRIDRHAAAIVADQHLVAGQHFDMDGVGVAGDGLVHGVVQHLGDEMVHRPLVGAADIHAGALADGLQPLQHLDVARGIGIVLGGAARLPPDRSNRSPLFFAMRFLSSSAARGVSPVAALSSDMVGKPRENQPHPVGN